MNKQNMKDTLFRKLLCILLSLLTAFCVFFVPVSAEAISLSDDSNVTYREAEEALSLYVDIEKLKGIIYSSISNATDRADIDELHLPLMLKSALQAYIFYGMPEAFNVDKLSFFSMNNELVSIGFTFRDFADTREEYAKCYSAMKKNADDILEGIENNPLLQDCEKALLLHDRLCVSTQYDYSAKVPEASHTAYGALVSRTAVCQGYTMAYMYLLDRVGIENYYCASEKLCHAWSIVYINKKAYHVDTTWDDISWGKNEKGVEGYVRHENFLRSTKGIKATDHNAADFDTAPTDTRYDDFYWQNSEAEFQLIGNKLYYIDSVNQKLKCADDGSDLADITAVWKAQGNGVWQGSFARLSSSGNGLLYSLPDGVYKYDVITNENEKIYTPVTTEGLSVFGFTYRDGNLILDINNAPPFGGVRNLYTLKAEYSAENADKNDAVFTEGEYIKSDGDIVRTIAGIPVRELLQQARGGYVTASDGTRPTEDEAVRTGMTLVLADGSRLDIAVYGDVNGDGRVSSADARLALRGSVGLEKYDEASACYAAANIDRSNKLLAGDARLILRTVVNLDWVGDWI